MKIQSHFKIQFKWLLAISVFFSVFNTVAQDTEKKILRFKPDKTFRIVQFTDVHWDNTKTNCKDTKAIMRMVLKEEQPDLIVLTGDIVTHFPATDGWNSIAAIMSESGIPWAVTLGNHDDEAELSRKDIFKLLETKRGFIGEQGPEPLSGAGNYVLEIKSSASDKTSALIYCLDSHGYPSDKKTGSYDWIKFDQIEWYRNQSNNFTSSNNKIPLPALAYFHIPTPEYKEVSGVKSFVGNKNEEVASPLLNSGLISSMIEMGDVMGTFTGHDHENNYIALYHSLALAYGQVTGVNAYGSFQRGARVVEIREGDYGFNTWIRTDSGLSFPYNFPFGGTYDERGFDFIKSSSVGNLKQGINFKYFEGTFATVDDFAAMKPLKQGITNTISIEHRLSEDHFGFEFSAWIRITSKGMYRFYTYSDDGSRLFIGSRLVVDNDSSHSAQRKEGMIALEEGYHEFRLLFFDDYMGQELEVGLSGLDFREKPISGDMLFINEEKSGKTEK